MVIKFDSFGTPFRLLILQPIQLKRQCLVLIETIFMCFLLSYLLFLNKLQLFRFSISNSPS